MKEYFESMRLCTSGLWSAGVLLLLVTPALAATTAVDEDTPWPRVRSTNGNTVTLHLPQVERWSSNWFRARAVVSVKPAKAKKELLGVAWFEAHGSVDHANRIVTLDRLDVTRANFPDAPDQGTNALAILREVVPGGARTVSLDYLVTALGFNEASAREGTRGLKHDPPQIIWATNRTLLILIDGEPVLRPVKGTSLERVINTPVLLLRDPTANRFYLEGDARWFAAESIKGPWSLAQSPPTEVAALSSTNAPASAPSDGTAPRIIVSTRPAELLMTTGLPDFRPIRGTALQYAADSDNQLFSYSKDRTAYLLLSGRWYRSASLHGPWNYVAPHDLPSDFAKIPPNSPQAIVLASVPDTHQAELAVIANSVPTTATVNRRTTTIKVNYDGEPKFKPIEGTAMSYAINAELPVIRTKDEFYAVERAVWFVAKSATGPWEVATEVPEEIYTIPASSPVYYATFVRVYDSDEETVETGYTSGYLGAYEDDGTIVYGTGSEYEPWYGDEYYYGWGWTWGYCYYYVPWYRWWVWRPWSNGPGGLRAALIENIYDRWNPSVGVTPHDRTATAANRANQPSRYAGNPQPSQYSNNSQPSRYSGDTKQSGYSGNTQPSQYSGNTQQTPYSGTTQPSPYSGNTQQTPYSGNTQQTPYSNTTEEPPDSGYPALYGRFKGSARPAPLLPPANTVALNPYERPKAPVHAGETPHGAQLLSTVRQSPGGGRDLYASQDGQVYLRKPDGWYRRENSGNWNFVAPTQGKVERNPVVVAHGGQAGAADAGHRIESAKNASGATNPRRDRVPDSGNRMQDQQVADLEREYYARTLSQYRAQNMRPNTGSAPRRTGGRR